MLSLNLILLPQTYAIHRLPPDSPLPDSLAACAFFSVTRTSEELSVVCPLDLSVHSQKVEAGWRVIQVVGPLDFSMTGVIARLSGALARAEISLFAVSTFDTDYLLVKKARIKDACNVLRATGCLFVQSE
jgi:hypothetical protein